MEAPTLAETFTLAPDLYQESWDPRMITALFEIGSISLFFWSSLLSLKKNSNHISEQLTTQKFENALNKIKDILKSIVSFEKTTDIKVHFEDSNISDDESEVKEKIRQLDKLNKTLFKYLLARLDPEKFQNIKNQETISDDETSNDMVHCARDLANHPEGKSTLDETQLSKEKAKYRLRRAQEENVKLRNNMERLLQKAEHWSKQHTELSGLIKSYQKSQHDLSGLLESSGIQQNNKLSATREMEEQVRKLECNAYSLQLTAALLENECQILQYRVGILNELHHGKDRAQTDNEQNKKAQKPSEAETVVTRKQKTKETEGTLQKRDNFYLRLDVYHNKKARNNLFNSRIARRGLVGNKRLASRSR